MNKRIISAVFVSIFALVMCGSESKKVDYDVVVIGAGGGGLAAAARLALAGKKVLVLEQHYKVGGYMSNFQRGDYTFEVSLHTIDRLDPENGVTAQFFKELDIYKRLKPVKLDPTYRIIFPGISMDIPADAEKYIKLLIEKFPQEKAGIENLFITLKRIEFTMNIGTEYMKGNYLKWIWETITHPLSFYTFIKYQKSTTAEFVGDFLKDKNLIAVFTATSCYLGDSNEKISGIMFAGMWDSLHLGGWYYLDGGSQSISNALADVIRENKGEILLSTRATKIIIDKGEATAVRAENVRTREIRDYTCSYVVSNANAPDTFFKLVGEENLPSDYVSRLKSMEIGLPSFNVYLGVKKDYTECFPKYAHDIFFSDSIDAAEIMKAAREGDVAKIGFGITNYSVLDPNAAPKGKNVICITTVLPYDMKNGWKLGEGYDKYTQYKKELAMKLVKRAERFLPGLSSNIEVMEVGTPITNKKFTSNPKGAIMGWSNTFEQSMMNRLAQNTPIKNLFLAGAWTRPAGGQSCVIMSGYLAADMILKD